MVINISQYNRCISLVSNISLSEDTSETGKILIPFFHNFIFSNHYTHAYCTHKHVYAYIYTYICIYDAYTCLCVQFACVE